LNGVFPSTFVNGTLLVHVPAAALAGAATAPATISAAMSLFMPSPPSP
jgi:hypothetical protein